MFRSAVRGFFAVAASTILSLTGVDHGWASGVTYNAEGAVRDSVSTVEQEPKIEYLSKRDFEKFCKAEGYNKGVTVVKPGDAYSLGCVKADGTIHRLLPSTSSEQNPPGAADLHINRVCQHKFPHAFLNPRGDPALEDRLADVGNTFGGWGCASFVANQRGPMKDDLENWCQSQPNEPILFQRTGTPYPAYSFFCTDAKRSHFTGIPMDKVCQMINKGTTGPGETVLDRIWDARTNDVGEAWGCRIYANDWQA